MSASFAHLGSTSLPRIASKLQPGGGTGHALDSQFNPAELAEYGGIVVGFFARLIGQVEPVGQQIHAERSYGGQPHDLIQTRIRCTRRLRWGEEAQRHQTACDGQYAGESLGAACDCSQQASVVRYPGWL